MMMASFGKKDDCSTIENDAGPYIFPHEFLLSQLHVSETKVAKPIPPF